MHEGGHEKIQRPPGGYPRSGSGCVKKRKKSGGNYRPGHNRQI